MAPRNATLRLVTIVLVTAAVLAALGLGLGASAESDTDSSQSLRERSLSGRPHPPGDDLELVFSEDFDEPLDPDLWGRCHWWQAEACTIESNDELELYLPDNVTSGDEVLTLEARRETVRDPDGRAYPYSSGMISTGPPEYETPARYAFTYGYVEARLRLPEGQGLWPAFWLLPADQESRPEIDVIETLGHRPDTAELHYHYVEADGDRASVGTEWSDEALADGDWHEYAVDWRPGRITWIIDGRERWVVTGDAVSDEAMYLVLNLAVGGEWPGDPDEDTEFPARVEAEWIRVWQGPEGS